MKFINGFDFYDALLRILSQIPEKSKSTLRDIALSLGDVKAIPAIREALEKEEYRVFKGKIVEAGESKELFKGFKTDYPLKKLAALQEDMSRRVCETDCFESSELIAGVDVSYRGDFAYAASVVLDSRFEVLDKAVLETRVHFPYIPGYLAFREAEPIKAVLKPLQDFDILIVNGHGVAHPRSFGLASHVGIELDKPTIGVAKRLLIGRRVSDNESAIEYRRRVIAASINRQGFKPIYVSVGNKISLESALRIVKGALLTGLPEPLRISHHLAISLKRGEAPPHPI